MRSNVVVVCSIMALAACNGTSSGNPINEKGGESEGPGIGTPNGGLGNGRCEREEHALASLEEETALGFSAADVLAFAEGTHASKIRWHEGFGEIEPEQGEQDVTLTITYADGEARHVTFRERESTGEGEGLINVGTVGGDCASQAMLEVDVEVQIQTGGGALDERASGTLRARQRNLASVQLSIDAEDLQGALSVTGAPAPGFTLDTLRVGLDLSRFGLRGSISGTFSSQDAELDPPGNPPGTGTSGVAAAGALASIGEDEHCDEGGFPIPADERVEGLSANDAIALVNALSSVQVSMDGGAETALELALEHDGDSVCALLGADPASPVSPPNALRAGGTLAIASADGRVDGEWPVRILATPAFDGEPAQVVLNLQGAELSQPGASDLEDTYGIQGVDASGHDRAHVTLELTVTQEEDGARIDGGFRVQAVDMVECPADPDPNDMSVPGCRGSDVFDLLEATVSGS